MSGRYKDDTFHMMDTFAKKQKEATGFGLSKETQKIEHVRGKSGHTWDAKHMTNFLNQSNYSNWSEAGATFYSNRSSKSPNNHRYNSSGDHFFRTTKDNKNVSNIGNTKVNPLVSIVNPNQHSKDALSDHLQKKSPQRYVAPSYQMRQDGNFRFLGNSVKFRTTDPLTLQNVEQKSPTEFQKTRMKWLIEKRHPHGMTGIDYPQDPETTFYKRKQLKNVRIRMQPNSHRDHLIDRDWKSKGRVDESYKKQYGFQKASLTQQRKFNNDDAHGFNIITNRFARNSNGNSD